VAPQPAAAGSWICLDVGETLIDETRVGDTWADLLGVTRLTFGAAFGATLAGGGLHREAFERLARFTGRKYGTSLFEEFHRAYGPFRSSDLYPDALPSLAALRDRGYRIAILANQPAERTAELRALGVEAEVMAMSDELGVAKPSPDFFRRAIELLAVDDPADVAYVGDRPDNDVAPALAAGMRAVWLRRGPWGAIWEEAPGAHLVVRSLEELVERIDEVWGPVSVPAT
jgi:HAD superfamily hydrolase (TIGR01549 family)